MNLRIFAVGVEHYQHSKIPCVKYAENDAQAFVDAWTPLATVQSSKVLLSPKATKTALWSRFKTFMADVTVGDTVVIFYAGHGYKAGDTNYITCHDTQPGDIAGTSLPLEDIFDLLRKSKSKKVMLFLDSCHSGMPTQEGMRSIVSEFTPDELKAFCKDSEFHVGFAACKVDEYSWPSTSLKHGIWTYCIIQALTGQAKKAFEKGELITGESLANYLSVEVPMQVQKIRTANEVQTPCVFGNATKTFIVANLEPLLTRHRAVKSEVTQGLRSAIFRGEKFGKIERLSGFLRGRHKVPDRVYPAGTSFVQNLGAEEVKRAASDLHDEIKSAYGYTRKQLTLENSGGEASIVSPDFRVDITINQDADDASRYRILLEVSNFRSPAVVTTENFDTVFAGHCDMLVVQFEQPISLEEKIDQIEEVDELNDSLRYEADLSEFTLVVPGSNLQIRMTGTEAVFHIPGSRDVKLLLENFRNSMKTITGSGLKLLPRN
jgi:Caspase domain